MAQRPDGKPSQTERVTFTKPAAERIAKVVRTVEGGDRDCAALSFGSTIGGVNQKVFRVCTFTGAWSIGSSKTVTFRGVTNTVSVTNLFYPAAPAGDCGIAKDGTAWFLVSVTMTQVSVITGVTLGTAGLQFTRAMLSVASTSTHSSVTIGTTACT
jgi:hypothetical protein